MKKLLIALYAAPLFCAVTNVRLVGNPSSTQALVAYDAPSTSACTIQLSQNSSLTPLALDVDPTIFANAATDLSRPSTISYGLARIVTLGQRTSQLATTGPFSGIRHYSRALQAYTPYFGKVTCGVDTATFNFTTGNVPLGQTYGDAWLSDSSHPGDQPWPEVIDGNVPESFIDPYTGVLLERIGVRGNNWGFWPTIAMGTAYNQGQNPCDTGHAWTNPCSTVVSGGSGSTTIGNSSSVLVIRPPLANNTAWDAGFGNASYTNVWTLDQLSFSLTGFVNSATDAARVLDICLSLNAGASCASSTVQMQMDQVSSMKTVGQADTTFLGTISWLLDTSPRFNVEESSPHSGTDTVSGSTVTWVSGTNRSNDQDKFSLYWTTGGNGRIRLSTASVADACAMGPSSAEYTITAFLDGNRMTVTPSPVAGSNFWCANNFAVMVWRDAPDSSTVTLTAASMAAVESSLPTYPDFGSNAGCLNSPIQGGYWCMYGGLYWINPSNGQSAFYGYMLSQKLDLQTAGVTNLWNNIGIMPGGEAADIDQTQTSTLTWYAVSTDPSNGGPLVVQGQFNPTTIAQPLTAQGGGRQISNATVSAHDAYSITYSSPTWSGGGLKFTNLTPQNPGGTCRTVVCQMASFDPSFNPAVYGDSGGTANTWSCQPNGDTAGTFFFSCSARGQDTPAWIFAFEPGDMDPTHAGLPGGPQIVGAISTTNTPNGPVGSTQTALTWRALHAMAEAGETGWMQINTHAYSPVSTTNTAIGSGVSADCSTFGLPAGTQCIKLTMNLSGGSYEPYLTSPQAPFTGTPGELRTAQIGDTACVSGNNSSCIWWGGGASELMALAIKGYNGVASDWVFQRNQFGTGNLATAGPTTYLRWQSIQNVLPSTATSVNGAMTAYWNPVAGCGGMPDPHGVCMIQDSNDTEAHGVWRDSGAVASTNVPTWAPPIWGYGTVYQTNLGAVPGSIQNTFVNLTPFANSGTNYTNAAPPFAKVYGHPWLFDAGSHPNAPGANAPPNEAIRAFDNAPVQGGQVEPAWTNVTGQLWSVTPASCSGSACSADPDDPFGASTGFAAINRKLMATGASCGSHPLIDISSPATGNVLPTDGTGSYKYCIPRANSECRSGSTAGMIFVNCPGVIPNMNSGPSTGCYGSAIHGGTPVGVGNDICIGNQSNEANAIRQFTMDRTDQYGSYARTLVTATSRLKMVYGFENNRLLPDNSWILYRAEWLNYDRPEMWAAKNLPYPPLDSVNRGYYVPVAIAVKPPGGLSVNNAIIQFGYQENGSPASSYCTSRAEACIANAATVPLTTTPFAFASEAPAGLACGSGCTISIPGISQRVLYYKVAYRDGSNNVIAQGPLTALVVP